VISNLHGIEPNDAFVDDQGRIWRVESMCDLPTITLRCLDEPGFKVCGAVGSPNLGPFKKLDITNDR